MDSLKGLEVYPVWPPRSRALQEAGPERLECPGVHQEPLTTALMSLSALLRQRLCIIHKSCG